MENEMKNDLEQLREEYAILKEELNKQKIINDRILGEAFKKSFGLVNFDKYFGIIGFLAMIPISAAIFIIKGIRLSLLLPIEAYLIICLFLYVLLYRKFKVGDKASGDVLSSVRAVKAYRKNYIRVTAVLWVLTIGLLIYLAPHVYVAWSTPAKAISALVIVGIILLASLCIQWFYSKKILRSCDEILERLQEGADGGAAL